MKTIEECLSELPEWQDDWKSHALFCAYDQDSSEEFVIVFWRRALLKIFDECLYGASVKIEDLKGLIHRKGRYPSGLEDIIHELTKREHLIGVEELAQKAEYTINSQYWSSWIGNRLKNMWKSPVSTAIVACPKKLAKLAETVTKLAKDNSRSTFMMEELSKFLNISYEELDVIKNFMIVQGSALWFRENISGTPVDLLKIATGNQEKLIVKPEDSAIVTLNLTLNEIDFKIKELTSTKEILQSNILKELKLQNKINAKHFLIRRKLIEKRIEELYGCRLNIEEQLLNISSSLTNKTIISTLEHSNKALSNITPDIAEITKIVDTTKDNIENVREMSNLLAEGGELNDEALLREFESLDSIDSIELPSVPDRPILVKRNPDKIEKVSQASKVILNS